MIQKKPTKATDETVKMKSSKAGLKQAPSRTRTRKTAPLARGPVPAMVTDQEIAQRAYALWESKGRPAGSQDEDWYRAKEELLAGR